MNKTNVQTKVKNLTTKILSKGSKQKLNTFCEPNLLQKVLTKSAILQTQDVKKNFNKFSTIA